MKPWTYPPTNNFGQMPYLKPLITHIGRSSNETRVNPARVDCQSNYTSQLTFGSAGKMLSTRRLYRGLKHAQQPQQAVTHTEQS